MHERQLSSPKTKPVNDAEGWNLDLMRACIEPKARVIVERELFQHAFRRTYLAATALDRLEQWMQKETPDAARQRLAHLCRERIQALTCQPSKQVLLQRLDRVLKPVEQSAV